MLDGDCGITGRDAHDERLNAGGARFGDRSDRALGVIRAGIPVAAVGQTVGTEHDVARVRGAPAEEVAGRFADGQLHGRTGSQAVWCGGLQRRRDHRVVVESQAHLQVTSPTSQPCTVGKNRSPQNTLLWVCLTTSSRATATSMRRLLGEAPTGKPHGVRAVEDHDDFRRQPVERVRLFAAVAGHRRGHRRATRTAALTARNGEGRPRTTTAARRSDLSGTAR